MLVDLIICETMFLQNDLSLMINKETDLTQNSLGPIVMRKFFS